MNGPARMLIALAALAAGPGLVAADLGIALEPASGIISEADAAVVRVGVRSDVRLDAPQLEVTGGELRVESAGVSQQLSFGTGRNISREVVHQFAVRGAPGSYTLRAVVTGPDGERMATEERTLRIRERTAEEKALDPELLIRLPSESVYVGEPVIAEIVLVEKPGTQFRFERTVAPRLQGDGFKPEIDATAYRADPADGNPAVGFSARITPLKAGEIEISAEFEPQIAVRLSNRGLTRMRRYSLTAEPVGLTVKPLPDEGRPEDFSGAVGSFDLSVSADPLELAVGEPIALRLAITGRGNFDLLASPEATRTEGWKFYSPTRMDVQRGRSGQADRLVFAQNVVPQQPLEEIPPFRLSVFDPQRGQYVTLLTDPIAIEVGAPAGQAPVAVAAPDAADAAPPEMSGQPTPRMTDILSVTAPLEPRWASAAAAAWRRPAFWALNGGLALALVLLAAAARRVSAGRAPSEGGSYEQRLHELRADVTSRAGAFYAAAMDCLSAWRRENPNLVPADAAAVGELGARHDFLHYAGNADAAATVPDSDERRQVIDMLAALAQP